MLRRVTAGLVVVGLAVGVWLIWPRSDARGPTSTTAVAAPPTTTSTVETTDPSAPPPVTPEATTTSEGSHVVETVEEAEAILRELWFGWFEGIYNQDEDRIREVVATEEQIDAAIAQFDVMEFIDAPKSEDIMLDESELLRSDDACIALWSQLDVSAFRRGATGTQGVYVIRRAGPSWYLLSVWPNRGDLWEADCESLFSASS